MRAAPLLLIAVDALVGPRAPPRPPPRTARLRAAPPPPSLDGAPPPPSFDGAPPAPLYLPGNNAFRGLPSTPGWRAGRFNELTDWATNEASNRPVVCEYRPDGVWLWTKWRGTVLEMTILPVVVTMALGAAVDGGAHALAASAWPFWGVPPVEDPLIRQLSGLGALWEYNLTLCTFILTFFTQQAYAHYTSVYFTTRRLQGRINDVCLLLAVGARRGDVAADGASSGYADEAKRLVTLGSRLARLSHTFFWASTRTLSNGVADGGVADGDEVDDLGFANKEEDAIGPKLLSPEGLQGLVDVGQLTRNERDALLATRLPPSQYAFILLEWVGQYAMAGLEAGTLRGGPGFEAELFKQLTQVRAELFSISDFAAGRMPLAYVQLVQLSKSFLDPFGNEGFPGQNIRVDVLVSELNFGAQSRWSAAGAVLPTRDADGPRPTDTGIRYQSDLCAAWPQVDECRAA
ncbi:hypothetical protein JL722_888 [Aureococcus anophagefferens]|nr:hypothetical protein JL722_888 [Aureococcus anophagefferens]